MHSKVNEVVISQRDFFKSGATLSYQFRKEALLKLRRAVNLYKEEISLALEKDLGKSSGEAYLTEIGMVLQSISYQLSHLRSFMRSRRRGFSISVFPSYGKIIPEPYGNVLVISPWNYPFLLAMDPMIGAVAAGNCVIVKPSEHSPNTSSLLEKMLSEIFDPSYIAVLTGDVDVAKELLDNRFDYIFYTGSAAVGKVVMRKAAEYLTPTTLELGGKSPCIIAPDADIAESVRRIIFGKSLNSGQTCVAPDYLLVHNSIVDEVVKEFSKQLTVDPQFYRIINEAHFKRLLSYLSQGEVIIGGGADSEALEIQFTLLSVSDTKAPIMAEEIFGPLLPVVTYSDEEQLVGELKSKEKPLAFYAFSRDRRFIKRLLREVSFGGGAVNDTLMHIVDPNLPFGGVGYSGMGAYHGKSSFDTFTHYKSVLCSPSGWVAPLRYPPYKGLKERLIKLFLR
ncbi:MAG: aldehyde dehydrogenase [Bacteroidales bacterium]|nr:aldehyde dehydrogenase [Bacteroidales bacterium]